MRVIWIVYLNNNVNTFVIYNRIILCDLLLKFTFGYSFIMFIWDNIHVKVTEKYDLYKTQQII